MIYGPINRTTVPEVVAREFPENQEFDYELQLRLRAVCDSTQERDSIYRQAKDAHKHVAAIGPCSKEDKRWYAIYW